MDCEIEAESFQHQALEIRKPGADFDPRAPPQNGEEFLMHMLYERKRCPAIVVKRPKAVAVCAAESTSAVKSLEEEMTTSPTLLPTVEWKALQVETFLTQREYISTMRCQQEMHPCNDVSQPITTESDEWRIYCQQHPPLLSSILHINQRSLEQMLDWVSEWLNGAPSSEDDGVELETGDGGTPSTPGEPPLDTSLSTESGIAFVALDLSSSEQWLGAWLYAVLACLHLPLEPAVHSTLRYIARACIRQRNHLQPQELDKAVPFNMFICLISKVFSQLDFDDYV